MCRKYRAIRLFNILLIYLSAQSVYAWSQPPALSKIFLTVSKLHGVTQTPKPRGSVYTRHEYEQASQLNCHKEHTWSLHQRQHVGWLVLDKSDIRYALMCQRGLRALEKLSGESPALKQQYKWIQTLKNKLCPITRTPFIPERIGENFIFQAADIKEAQLCLRTWARWLIYEKTRQLRQTMLLRDINNLVMMLSHAKLSAEERETLINLQQWVVKQHPYKKEYKDTLEKITGHAHVS